MNHPSPPSCRLLRAPGRPGVLELSWSRARVCGHGRRIGDRIQSDAVLLN